MDQLFILDGASGNIYSTQGTSFRVTETKGTRTGASGQVTTTASQVLSHFSATGGTPAAVTNHQLGYISKSGKFFAITD